MPKYNLINGFNDLPKLVEIMKKMTLYGLEDKITCPLLTIQAASEEEESCSIARAFFDKLPNPKNEFVITTEEQGTDMHCQKGNASLLDAIEFDWLDEIMG